MRELEFEFINNYKIMDKELIYFDLFSFTYTNRSCLNAKNNLTIIILGFEFGWWWK